MFRVDTRLRLRDTSGFTMVEVVIAVGIVTVLITALTAALGAGLAATREAKRFQQGTEVGNAAVEKARDANYAELAMLTSDVDPATDARIKTACTGLTGTRFVDPDDNGPLKCEAIDSVLSGGAVYPHATTETVAGVSFTVHRYVTWVDATVQGGTATNYKRVVAIVEWDTGKGLRTYRTSTLVADARRGISAATFVLTPPAQGKQVRAGYRVVFPHTIQNFGPTDTYDLVFTEGPQPPTRPDWKPTFHRDLDRNGEYDEATESAALTDTNGNGTVDTGPVPEGTSFAFLMEWTLSTAEVPTTTEPEKNTLDARSTLDPQLHEQATDTLAVRTTPIDLSLYLHNRPTPPIGSTTAQIDLSMTEELPTATQLYPYSTDVDPERAGRVVTKGSNGNESDPKKMVNWRASMSGGTSLDGNATLRVFPVASDLNCFPQAQFTVYLRHMTADGKDVKRLSPDQPVTGCPLSITLPIAYTSIAFGRVIELKLIVSSTANVVFAYDTVSFAAVLTLPRTSAPL